VAWLVGQLRMTQGQLAAALTSTVDGVVLTDSKNRIVFLNPVSEALTGWTRQEAAGRQLGEIVRVVGDAHGGGKSLTLRDGTAKPIEYSVGPIRGDRGGVQGFIIVFRDISERRQFEEELRQAQKMEALGRIASSVAHDFNNLLTVVGGHAELIANAEDAPPAARRSAETIRSAFDQATRLTRQLLAFSRRQPVQLRSLDLNHILGKLEPTLRSLVGNRINLVTDFEPDAGHVKADTGQIEQVMVNLLVNCRDAMPNGGTATIRTRNTQVFAPQTGETRKIRPGAYVLLEVIDTGIGMDDKTKSKIFEPFFTTKPSGKGTGLGLAIVYGIVQYFGGHIQVDSQPGRGSSFSIFFPRSDEFGGDTEQAPPAAESKPGNGLILLSEDDDVLRELLCGVLKSNGYEVMSAADGGRALNIAAVELSRIDLVVTDIDMPVVSGTELMQYLWTLNPRLPVLYLSGHEDLGQVATSGGPRAHFLAKPFSLKTLVAEVATLLPSRQPL
jgi:two-component system cell cycle sensor histidine kinase/response regulator CckA